MIKKLRKIVNKIFIKKLTSNLILIKVTKFLKPALAVIVVIFVIYYFKGSFIAAVVNNHPITRYSLDRDLEKQGGKQVLENKITEILILQELNKQNITIPQADIDQKIKEIEDQVSSQGQKLDSLLAMQGQTKKDLENQLKLQIAVEKILGKDVNIGDKEIADSFEQNKSTYEKDAKIEDKKEEIKTTLYRQAISEKFQPWIEEIKKNSKIYYFLKL